MAWWRKDLLLYAALAIACTIPLLLPGDAPFINDDAMLLYKALRANQAHRLEHVGLLGSQGARYGPLPVWIYQGMLLVTHDPRVLVVLHAAIFTAATAASLLVLARTLRLPAWFAVVVILSPYLWFYSRLLWDNSWCIPLSCALLAAYARFLTKSSRLSLVMVMASATALLLTHLMSVPLVVPLIAHLVTIKRRELRHLRWTGVGAAAACLFAASPYLRVILNGSVRGATVTATHDPNGWWFPLLGGRVLSGANLSYFFGPDWADATPVRLAQAISLIAFPLIWWGIVLAMQRVLRADRAHAFANLDHFALISLAALVLQIVMSGVLHVFGHPHYYNGTWVIYPLFAWLAIDAIPRPGRCALIAAWTASLAVLTIATVLRIHACHGVRNFGYGSTLQNQSFGYGITLQNQIDVVRDLNRAGHRGPFLFVTVRGDYVYVDPYAPRVRPTIIPTEVRNYLYFPHAANVIQELMGDASALNTSESSAPVMVRYDSPDPADARVTVSR